MSTDRRRTDRPLVRRAGLAATVLLAAAMLIGVSTALMCFDARSSGADALRTGGLAAGSVVALYALWLNDRRRRVEESRQQLDTHRVADERFGRALELLGHEADQVRVGAMHALAGLARTDPGHTQTVLDILCAYLRRPFAHPRYSNEDHAGDHQPADGNPCKDGNSPDFTPEEHRAADQELQVRLTAQRLVVDLLPTVDDTDGPHYDLDLTGAILEYFDASGHRIGRLTARNTRLMSRTSFSRCEFHGPVWFTGMTTGRGRLAGHFHCADAVFHDRAWFSKVTFQHDVTFDRTKFLGRVKFADSQHDGALSFDGTVFASATDIAVKQEVTTRSTHCDVQPQALIRCEQSGGNTPGGHQLRDG